MDGALAAALGVIGSAVVTGAAAMYGSKVAGRAQREGGALTGYNNLTDQLQEERKELREDLRAARIELAANKLEIERLRLLVQSLGGTP